MSNMDHYTKFIAEQVRKEGVIGLRTNVREPVSKESKDKTSQKD